jgi:putative colanic acid biosynthesis acetyltransferase WcaF
MKAESADRIPELVLGHDAERPETAVERPRVDLGTYQKNHDWVALVQRGLWSCVQIAFWPKRPRWLSGLRVGLLRLFGAKIGRNVLICGGVRVTVPWLLEMDDYAVLGDDVEVYNLAAVRIGAHAVISQRSYLCTASHDYTQTDFPLYSEPITIGPQSWVAAGVFVGPGRTVGEGSVVGAHSVVTRDVMPWMVAAGNPCRVIKLRELRQK